MSNCYVKVIGGVGNQLFQIAAGYAYSEKHDKCLYIDDHIWGAGQGIPPSHYKDTLFENFEYQSSHNRDVSLIHEHGFNYNELPFYEGDVALHGYFQSLKYFQECKNEFIEKIKLPIVNTNFIRQNSIAFHIRRGDYLNLPHIFNVCGTEYWNKLFKQFEDYEINVCTDSPDYVLREFNGQNFRIIRGNSEIEDLTIMANHPNMICSNSSFSWWASILGVEKTNVIVPDKWLLDRDCSDIYYEGMTIITT